MTDNPGEGKVGSSASRVLVLCVLHTRTVVHTSPDSSHRKLISPSLIDL